MPPTGLHFFPLAHPFVLGLLFFLGLLIALIEIGVIGYAYEKVGVQRRYVFALLLLSLLGSYVNIPVAELPAERIVSAKRSRTSACATSSRWLKSGRGRSSPST
jgi:uncharacterized membrane protein